MSKNYFESCLKLMAQRPCNHYKIAKLVEVLEYSYLAKFSFVIMFELGSRVVTNEFVLLWPLFYEALNSPDR
jgi:hypothetical protein